MRGVATFLTVAAVVLGCSAVEAGEVRIGDTTADQPDPKRLAAHVLALRSGVITGDKAAISVLAKTPGAGPAKFLPGLWRPFFENAIIKLGRLRTTAPVALYYNPLLDVALITWWEQRDGGYRVTSIRGLPGERLADSGAAVSRQPQWLGAEDSPIESLARIATARLETFRRAHPARTTETGQNNATFASAATDMRAALPRLAWLLALRAQWTEETAPWLFPSLAGIDKALAVRDAAALSNAAPDTDPETAAALAHLPASFGERLTLDMTLEIGGPDRLLITSLPDDGDIYVFVLCRLDGDVCALRRFLLLSLSTIQQAGKSS